MTVSPELLTVSEAATVAGVSVRTVRRWIAGGQVVTSGRGHGRQVVAASLSKLSKLSDNEDTNGHEERSPAVTVSAMTDTETANADNFGPRVVRTSGRADGAHCDLAGTGSRPRRSSRPGSSTAARRSPSSPAAGRGDYGAVHLLVAVLVALVNGQGAAAIILAAIVVVLIVLLLFVLPDLGGMDPGGAPVP